MSVDITDLPIILAVADPDGRRRFVERVMVDKSTCGTDWRRLAGWEVVDVPLTVIQTNRRRSPGDASRIADLDEAFRRGVCFPPLIVEETETGDLRLLDGAARLRVFRAHRVRSYPCMIGRRVDTVPCDRKRS